ncbi:hypothetical protein BH18ACI4_BH18ACI4_05110 [soil metagenome]
MVAAFTKIPASLETLHNGKIDYNRRGRMTILDRQELEATACECYRIVRVRIDSLVAYN